MIRFIRTALFMVVLALLINCQRQIKDAGGHLVSAEVLYSSIQCSREDKTPAITWITDGKQIGHLHERLGRSILGSEPKGFFPVDFDKEGALLIEMGQRPTAGYQFSIGQNAVWVSDNTVNVKVSWIEPEAGTLLAQVITSPCILLKFQTGHYNYFRILDQNNKVRIETKRP